MFLNRLSIVVVIIIVVVIVRRHAVSLLRTAGMTIKMSAITLKLGCLTGTTNVMLLLSPR